MSGTRGKKIGRAPKLFLRALLGQASPSGRIDRVGPSLDWPLDLCRLGGFIPDKTDPLHGSEKSKMRNIAWTVSLMAGSLLLMTGCAEGFESAPAGEEPVATAPQTQTASSVRPARAEAKIEGRSGSSLSGNAEFSIHDGLVMILVEVKGAPPGVHAVHVHEIGDCTAPDGKSAGGHFNPGGHPHGGPDTAERHAGDLGNMTVKEDGAGSFMVHTDLLAIAEGDSAVTGRAIVIHEKADDYVSQPTGAAGGRIGCGVINLVGEGTEEEEAAEMEPQTQTAPSE